MRTKLYVGLGVAAIFTIGILGGWLSSSYKISKLENAVEASKQVANEKELQAAAKENEAAGYKQKIEYLEGQLGEIGRLARKQDEELEKLNISTRGARADVEHARRTRSIAATTEQLCEKLAQVGHPCD